MNLLALTGNIGRDAEVRVTPSGTSIASFSVAMTAGYGERKSTVWIKASIFGKRAEGGLIPYLVKGTQVAVTGELSLNEWTTQDGEKRTDLQVNVSTIDLIGGKPQQQAPQQAAPAGGQNFDDSIPF